MLLPTGDMHSPTATLAPLRVVIADDSLLIRAGLQRLLARDPTIKVVAVVGDLWSLTDACERLSPDVVVTDTTMPPTGTDEGIRAAAELRARHPRIGVVVLGARADPGHASALLEHGSSRRAYLLKGRVHHRAELTAAIHAVANGGSVIDPKVVERLVAARAHRAHSPPHELTPREREVLEQIAEGKSNAAIAASLCLTKRAVEKHINAIFLKLGLADAKDSSKRVKATLMLLAGDTLITS